MRRNNRIAVGVFLQQLRRLVFLCNTLLLCRQSLGKHAGYQIIHVFALAAARTLLITVRFESNYPSLGVAPLCETNVRRFP